MYRHTFSTVCVVLWAERDNQVVARPLAHPLPCADVVDLRRAFAVALIAADNAAERGDSV